MNRCDVCGKRATRVVYVLGRAVAVCDACDPR